MFHFMKCIISKKNDIRSSTSRRGNRSRRIHSNHHQERSTSKTNTRIARRTTRWKIASTCSTLIRARWLPNSDVGIGAQTFHERQLFDQKVVLNSNRMTSDLMFLKVRTGVRKCASQKYSGAQKSDVPCTLRVRTG